MVTIFDPPDHLALCSEAISQYPQAILVFGDYQRFTDSDANAASPAMEGKKFFAAQAAYVANETRLPSGPSLFRMDSEQLLRFCCLRYCPISTPSVVLNRKRLSMGMSQYLSALLRPLAASVAMVSVVRYIVGLIESSASLIGASAELGIEVAAGVGVYVVAVAILFFATGKPPVAETQLLERAGMLFRR